jgi:microcystin-dependent protein
MSDQFLAEIRIFPFNFPPTGWAFCNGQLLPISQNTALFALLGTTYGGDGKSTFALPNLQGSAPMQPGQGAGLSLYDLGQLGGTEAVTLLGSEMPIHNHFVTTDPFGGDKSVPAPDQILANSTGGQLYVTAASNPPLSQMAPQALSPAGGGLPHNNMQPYLTLNFCIAMQGIFPQRP